MYRSPDHNCEPKMCPISILCTLSLQAGHFIHSRAIKCCKDKKITLCQMSVITFHSSLFSSLSFFFLTSGTVVMLMTSAPQALNMRLSALVENLGPSTVTIVPFWNLKCEFKESDFSCSFFFNFATLQRCPVGTERQNESAKIKFLQ